jgi:hypothetical protein
LTLILLEHEVTSSPFEEITTPNSSQEMDDNEGGTINESKSPHTPALLTTDDTSPSKKYFNFVSFATKEKSLRSFTP